MHPVANDERAREALYAIPADLPRDEWVRVGMAAQAAGLDFDDFNEWSSQGSSYDERETAATWRSIKPGKGIGAGTLFKTAALNGWRPADGRHSPTAVQPVKRAVRPLQARSGGGDADALWERCNPATFEHHYIQAKGGVSDGLRVVPADDSLRISGASMAGALAIPVTRPDGSMSSLQLIASAEAAAQLKADGRPSKLNLPGCAIEGWHVVGAVAKGSTIYLCEGIGQAWACWKSTGHPAVVCFGWGRVRKVATELRKADATASLVIVPDVGKEDEARTIARDLKGRYITLPEGWAKNSDVNDFAHREGFDVLEELLRKAKAPPVDGVVLLNGADLVPQPVSWLWRNWLALGKLHILAGAPGQGKTTIALAMAATVTTGGRWPDGSRCEVGSVLVWSGEDDPADTLLPRLIAAGADKARVHFISGTRVGGELQPFDPSTDMAQLEAQAHQVGDVRLLIVDPVVSAVTGDSHKNTEVRRALQPLVDLAAAIGAALVGISHFSKGGQGQDPASRVVGSIAFTAVARVVLVAAKVKGEDGEDRRILARGKSNIGPDDGGFEYSIGQVEALPGIQASRIDWGNAVEGSARELLSDPTEQETEDGNAQDSAAAFLREVLKEDTVPVKSIEAEAKEAGIAWRTIRRASDALNVIKKRGTENRWYWSMPRLSKSPMLSNLSNVSALDNMDKLPVEDGWEALQ